MVGSQDVQFLQSDKAGQSLSVIIQFRKSKNNQWGLPQRVYLVQSGHKDICPVAALWHFSSIRPRISSPFFCHFDGNPLTGLQFNAVLQKVLNYLGLNKDRIKGHSFRIGAASTAWHLGISPTDIQHMGRWRSDAFLAYIRPLLVCNNSNQ